jgi:hypothetical protein
LTHSLTAIVRQLLPLWQAQLSPRDSHPR